MENNYTAYHLHTQLSLLDSCTKFQEYVDRAKDLGMKAMAFSEHGNLYEYYHKKQAIEAAGMKYIHAIEVYITEEPTKNVRDNYHCVLLSSGLEGFYELNRLVSQSWNRQNVKIVGNDARYYYAPRFTIEDIENTSDNIFICSACVASPVRKASIEFKKRFISFLVKNKHRCYLEIQHHNVPIQKEYNAYLYKLHQQTGIPLITGTDTHALDERHVKGRTILQKSKGISFDDEQGWDLTFKSYDELVEAYRQQDALPMEVVLEAIDNTNKLADKIEPFVLTTETKYAHIYDNSVEVYKKKINEAFKNHKYINKRYPIDQVRKAVQEELDVYIKTKSIDFMLLQVFIREWEKANGIQCGYSRGSVSGSVIAYILGITEMDSIKFGLNFFRFMNPSRVTNADIDSDYSGEDRERVKTFLLRDHMGLDNIQCSEIITFNTIALKGAIRDVCRGLYADTNPDYLKIASYICENVEQDETRMREEYPEVFEYVDILNGTVVSVGSHPSGVLVTDIDLASKIGLCSLSTSDYPVSMLNMKELDALMYTKMDILGLDNIGVINDTCKLLGIERLTPDNVDLDDEVVWKSIRDDTTLVFQWESSSAQDYLKRFMSDRTIEIAKAHNPDFSWIKWFSFGNGLIRPGCASFRDSVANGEILVTGFKELDEFLSTTMGRITMQEDIMRFLVRFCGYSDAESDTVRRGIAKKYGTEKFIDEIHARFIQYSHENYGVDNEKLEEIFPPIKQGILDATAYAFSWNHSDAYSCTGYICGYLRYYHPLEFLTAAFNIFTDKEEKILTLTDYAKKRNIEIHDIKFRHSGSNYTMDKESNSIYKGMISIKYLSEAMANDLYELGKKQYNSFMELLADIKNIACDTRQLDILIKLDFFSEFGNPNQLLAQVAMFNKIYGKKQFKKDSLPVPEYMMKEFASKESDKMYTQVDTTGLLNKLCELTKDIKTSLLDRLAWQADFLGYLNITKKNWPENVHYVQEIDGNWVTLYRMKDGYSFKIKTRAKYLKKNPFVEKQLIKILEIAQEKKYIKLDNGDWGRSEELEDILKEWQIIKEK